MRFMMLMIPGGYQGAEGQQLNPEFTPPQEMVDKMMKFNEDLSKSGALLSGDGLHHPSTGARVSYSGGKPLVTDGPFPETKEVLGGYWIIRTSSREEAIEWAKKVPAEENDVVEVRQIFDMEDYPENIQVAIRDSGLEMGV